MNASQKLTCREFIQFLHEYYEGSQPPHVRAAFEAHLTACADCRAYLETYRDTIKLAHSAACDDEDVLHTVPHGLIKAVLKAMPCP